MFKQIKLDDLNENWVKKIHYEWALIVTNDTDKVNAMTANWLQMGWLWNKNIVTVYVRPERHTFTTMENSDVFSVAFFSPEHRKKLTYLGTASGKDEDKLAKCEYHTTILDGAPVIEEADLVFTVKKLYQHMLKDENFLVDSKTIYPEQDFHLATLGEIIHVYQKTAD